MDKLCTACGVDVAGQPRVKNKRGDYFCEPCVERIKAKRAAFAKAGPGSAHPDVGPTLEHTGEPDMYAPAPVPGEPVSTSNSPHSTAGDDLLGQIIDDAVHSVSTCPNCGSGINAGSRICVQCGHNIGTGRSIKTKVESVPKEQKRNDRRGIDISGPLAVALNPTLLGSIAMVVFSVMALIGASNPAVFGAFVLMLTAYGFAVGVWTIVAAFMDSFVNGLLCMFIWIYSLYWVYAESDSPYLQWATTANIVGWIAMLCSFFMIAGNAG